MQVCETICIEDNCDPMYYQTLELVIDYQPREQLPPFIFDVYDVDKSTNKSNDRDYIGRCIVNLEDASKKYVCESYTDRRAPGEIAYELETVDMKPEAPKWHSIRYAPGSPECGQILVSFAIAKEFDHDWRTPAKKAY